MIRAPPSFTLVRASASSDVYKRQDLFAILIGPGEPPRQERAEHDQLPVGEVEHLRRAVDEDDAQGDDGDDAAVEQAGGELLGDELPVHNLVASKQ